MQVLPEGWELDYDGSRWIYHFTASGLTQYQFPKPGDEFPEFAGVGGFFTMAPEDCLASDRQVKRQTMEEVGSGTIEPSTTQRRKKSMENIKEVAAAEYFDTEKFMYLGPGSFFGSNPVGDQQTRIELDAKQSDSEHQQTPSSTKQRGEEAKATLTDRPIADNMVEVHGDFGIAQRLPPQLPGDVSKAAKPREGNATTAHSIRSKPRLQSPVGFVAELDSQETRKRADHKSNIEFDVPERSIAGGIDVHFDGLVEIPADGNQVNNKQPPPQEARVASADSYPLVSASFAFPPLPPKHPIDPPKTGFSMSGMLPQKSSSLRTARPFSCHEATMSRDNEPSDRINRSEPQFASMPEISTLPQTKAEKPHRHSVHGPGPVAASPSRHSVLPMPSSNLDNPDSSGGMAFKNHQTTNPAPRLPPKIPLGQTEIKADSLVNTAKIPCSEARHESISSDTGRSFTSSSRFSGLAQCPSVLRPGYYRSGVTGPPQQNQRPSVIAAPDGQQPHQQYLPMWHSNHAHGHATRQAEMRPQGYGGLRFEEPVVCMPDERDFMVRPTATTRAASEPFTMSWSTTANSFESSSNCPGLMTYDGLHPIGSRRESEPAPIPSCTREPWAKDTYELVGDMPLPNAPHLEEGTKTKLDQPLPFVAPLRLSPSPSRRQAELPPSIANAAQELAAMSLAQQETIWSTQDLRKSAQTNSNSHYRVSGSTNGADGMRRHAPQTVDTIPLKPASRPVLSRPIDRASGAGLSGPQAPSPLTRPVSLAQSEISSSSGSNASLYHVPVSTTTPGLRLCEAPGTLPSASATVPRYADKQTPTRDQQTAGIPPAVGKARGSSAWSTSSINYSGDEWGQNWQEECPGIVPEDYLPSTRISRRR